jgi:uncharacterized membrane protein (DUF485 family)
VQPDKLDFHRVAQEPGFRSLLASKRRFIIPATICFVVYYFALIVLVGYEPDLMSTPVLGPVNLAYLFALSQFLVAWLLAGIYVRVASKWDERGKDVLRVLLGKGND